MPRYLAEFQYRFNRRYDLTTILPRLLRASALTPPMPYRLLIGAEVAFRSMGKREAKARLLEADINFHGSVGSLVQEELARVGHGVICPRKHPEAAGIIGGSYDEMDGHGKKPRHLSP